MRRIMALGLAAVLGFGAFAMDGEQLYKTYCAGCHQETGEGIPGQYPFIDGPVARLSAFPEGREFLIATVLFGLQGEMMQRGYVYNGVMPGFKDILKDEDVAALLNWMLEEWSSRAQRRRGAAVPYQPDEVAQVRALNLTPEQVMDLMRKVEEVMHGPAGNTGQGPGQGRGKGRGRGGK